MAIKLTTTAQSVDSAKILVFGDSGVGKTRLIATAPKPLIVSSENKLMSIRDEKIPVATIENHEDLEEIHRRIIEEKKYQGFETIALDSVSDIAETILDYFQRNPVDGNTHPQAAYGSMAKVLLPLLKKFRDLPGKNVYFIAKAKFVKDEHTGIMMWMPSMPGQQLGPALPYLFDLVCPMRIGETEKGEKYRYLQTASDIQWLGKDSSGILSFKERPHLGKLFNKILGEKKVEKQEPKKEPKEDKEESTPEAKEEKETTKAEETKIDFSQGFEEE